jgi:molecular chaperone HscB
MKDELSLSQLNSWLKSDAFQVFELEYKYDIDLKSINQKYLQLQKQLHPDKWLNSEKSHLILLVSAHINDKYKCIKSPLLRAIELLEINKLNYNANEYNQFTSDFLVQQMEYREQIENNSDNLEQLQTIETQLLESQNLIIAKLVQVFANKDYIAACKLTKELAFYQKLNESVELSISNLDQ